MRLLFLKEVNTTLELKNEIQIIRVEDVELYRKYCFKLYESLTFSIDDFIYDLDKYGLIIHNPIDISLNEKRFVTTLYKAFESVLDDECRNYLAQIESSTLNLLELLAYKTGFEICYSECVDFTKLMSAFNMEFESIESSNYATLLIRYCKLVKELFKVKCIFSFGISSLLTKDEVLELNYVLKQLDLDIIDIIFSKKSEINTTIIDSDWCIL